MGTPAVSFLMPVHNGARYLREAAESVRNQTFQDYELIAIEDGSTDGTREILVALAQADSRVRVVINSERLGIAGSLNRGLDLARGEWVARMDADDFSEPRRLERQVDFLRRHTDAVLVGSWATVMDENGKIISRQDLPCDHEDLLEAFLGGNAIVHGSVVFRSALRERYDPNAGAEDFDLWVRMARAGRLANLAEYLYRYRVTGTGYSRTEQQRQSANAKAVAEEHRRNLMVAGRFDVLLKGYLRCTGGPAVQAALGRELCLARASPDRADEVKASCAKLLERLPITVVGIRRAVKCSPLCFRAAGVAATTRWLTKLALEKLRQRITPS